MSSQSRSSFSLKYDVFLSFGDVGTHSFSGRLYRKLHHKGISTFRYGDLLSFGDEMSRGPLREIEASEICLIVFTQYYASSRCLDELVQIIERRRSTGWIVIPIFYKVEPSDLRLQRGAIGEAFAEHERRFKDDMDKVSRWRAALEEAATLIGWHFSDDGDEDESIRSIVKHIFERVQNPISLDMPKYQVGLNSRVEQMLEMLDVGGSDVRMVGIWGIAGIGKTTIAKAVYDAIVNKFEHSCFLANVRKLSVPHDGLVNLQKKILILGDYEFQVINSTYHGTTELRKWLRTRRMLLVLDDVDQLDQLRKLAGDLNWFGSGSRVIITTRDMHLIAHKVSQIYKAPELDLHEARELICANALMTYPNLDKGEKFAVETFVICCGGLPLALKVLGSHLCTTPIHQWEDYLKCHRRSPLQGIQKILRISYDSLEDQEKEIFLAIACFYKGMKTNDVIQILEVCGLDNAKKSIKILEEEALIYVGEYGHICMHDLLEDMGKDIVWQESIERGEPNRLWNREDVVHAFSNNSGTSKIEGIVVGNEICLRPEFFRNMENLKILMSSNARFFGEVNHFPDELQWPEYELQSFLSKFETLGNLASLILRGWFLEKIPDMSGRQNLDFLDLSWCIRLKEVHPSVGSLQNLTSLCLSECILLDKIPDMSGSQNLKTLDLCWCICLKEVHPSVGSLQNLRFLYLSECILLEKIPDMSRSQNLEQLYLRRCIRLKEVHPSVGSLQNLTSLYLRECILLEKIPDMSGSQNLKFLDLSRCLCLKEVHPSVGSLQNLTSLHLSECILLEKIPDTSGSQNLKFLYLSGCKRLKECLTLLDLSGTAIKELPASINDLESLEELVLKECENLTKLPSKIYELQHLWCLDLQNCSNLVEFPDWSFSKSSHNLWYLNLRGCKKLEVIPELPPTVEWINVADCLRLKKFVKLSNIKESEMMKCITMFNCQRLCGSLALEIAESRDVFRNEVSLCSHFLSCKQSEFNIVFPGSEVPKWFSGGKDLMKLSGKFECSFEIPPNTNLGNKGIAICVVAAAVENFKPEGAEIKQQSYFTATVGVNADRIVTRSLYFEAKDVELAHVWLCYMPFVKFVSCQSPPFTCRISLEHSSQGSTRIKSFGVHLVFPQEEEEEEEDEDEDH